MTSIDDSPGELTLTDATPTRIKREASGRATPARVRVHRPATVTALADVVRDLAAARTPFVVVGAASNVVGALDVAGVTAAVSTEALTAAPILDPVSGLVRVGAGTRGGWLEDWLADRGRTLGQFPQSLHISTVGGWLATRACGSLSARHGGIEQAVRGAVVVAPDGRVLTFGPRVRPAGGFDGLGAVVGSEGSLGVVAEVVLETHRRLPERVLCAVLPDLGAVVDAQRELVQGGYPVALLRGHDVAESEHIVGAPVGGCLLLASTVGPPELVDAQYEAVGARLNDLGARRLADDAAARWFADRYRVETMMADRNEEPGSAFDTIELSVPWSSAAACAEAIEAAVAPRTERFHLHFSHAYPAGTCLYGLVWLRDPDGDDAVLARLTQVWDVVLDLAERHGGTIGHHHGVGAVRADRYQRGPDAAVHRALKAAWDPDGLLRARLLEPSPG